MPAKTMDGTGRCRVTFRIARSEVVDRAWPAS